MSYKFIMFDIDGTLVSFDGKRHLHPKNLEMLTKLHEQGVLLGLASGRSITNLLTQKDEFGIPFQFDCLIGINGAQMFDNTTGNTYKYYEIEPDTVREIITMMEPTGCNCHIYCENYTIYLYEDAELERAKQYYTNEVRVATCIDDMCQQPAPKVQYSTPLEKSKEIEAYAIAHCTDKYDCVRTTAQNIEFMAKGCSKLYAVEQFCRLHGFTLEEAITFGDNTNDNTMLVGAGLGVCLADGNPDTKKLSNAVTEKSCAEGGVGYYLEKHYNKLF